MEIKIQECDDKAGKGLMQGNREKKNAMQSS